MRGADLTAYAEQAFVVGAQAISAVGGTQGTFNLEQLVQDVGRRTAASSTRLQTSLNRLLLQAQTALAGVPLSAVNAPGTTSSTGAA
ncbi:MAG: hypothetical protein ABI746_12910 [Dermatophilaceae bacterium]